MTQFMIYPKSSHIECHHRDPESGDVTMHFHNGTRGVHKGVPADIYQGMCEAPSCGSFYHANIRGKFPWEKLEEE